MPLTAVVTVAIACLPGYCVNMEPHIVAFSRAAGSRWARRPTSTVHRDRVRHANNSRPFRAHTGDVPPSVDTSQLRDGPWKRSDVYLYLSRLIRYVSDPVGNCGLILREPLWDFCRAA